MPALRAFATDGPRSVRLEQIPVPQPAQGEVVVRIRAAALNHRDVFITQGKYPRIRLPVTLGSDGAGETPDGDAVVIDPMLEWGDDTRVWDASKSSILGMPRDGTFARYCAVPRKNVHPKPAALSFEEAAAIPLGGLTAYRATFTRGNLRAGETVLIPGIGGGVATFVLLFAKHIGARAIVTSSSDEKLRRARELGADLTVNYRTSPDWSKIVRAAGPVDLVVDSSGGPTLKGALEAITPGGRIVVYGGTAGDATIPMFPLFWNHVTIAGTSMGSPGDFQKMLELFASGLRPVIDRAYALEEGAAAFERLDAGDQFGKVVLTVD
jgi:NADPH:quinone reductase-like Zn-dependent oxidoreductase